MRERDIEQWLRRQIENMGGKFVKFVSPGNNGMPDRIAIMPGGKVWFVELKTDKGRLSALQEWQRQQLETLGCQVRHVWGKDEAADFIKEVRDELIHMQLVRQDLQEIPEPDDRGRDGLL